MSKPIESNIPEGTLWPDLDDAAQIRAERMQKLLDETYSRPFATLKDTAPISSERNQRASYDRIRAYADMFAAQSALTPGQWANARQDPFANWWHNR